MKTLYLLLLLFFGLPLSLYSQVQIISWNLENFGQSKTDEAILFMAETIKHADIVAIQEVVAGYGGAPAVAKLAVALNRTGSKWDYSISNPTSSSAYKTERYAFFWKTKKVKLIGKAWLESFFEQEIDREPYFATFEQAGKRFTVASFHAITKSKQPEKEIKYFKYLPQKYPALHLVLMGDFNCPQSHSVFYPLKKMGFAPILVNQKTSLRQSCKAENDCLASEFDNAFCDMAFFEVKKAAVVDFYTRFENLQEARKISDHCPIEFELIIK